MDQSWSHQTTRRSCFRHEDCPTVSFLPREPALHCCRPRASHQIWPSVTHPIHACCPCSELISACTQADMLVFLLRLTMEKNSCFMFGVHKYFAGGRNLWNELTCKFLQNSRIPDMFFGKFAYESLNTRLKQ